MEVILEIDRRKGETMKNTIKICFRMKLHVRKYANIKNEKKILKHGI